MANTNIQHATLTRVTVPERGMVAVDAAVWQQFGTHPDFARLLEARVVSKIEPHAGTICLAGTGYVGCAVIGGVCIDIVEKVPGLLEQLLVGVTAGAFKVARLRSPASAQGTCIALVVHQFLDVLRTDVAMGMDMAYTRTVQTTNRHITGPINIRHTIAARAHGRPNEAAFNHSNLSGVTPKNQVLYAALREVDRLQQLVELPSGDRGAIPVFLDLLTPAVRDRSWWTVPIDARQMVGQLLTDPMRQDHDLLMLAQVILEHASFDHMSPTQDYIPRSWFLKLELLFQAAILRTLQRCYDPVMRTRTAAQAARPIFSVVQNRYRAHPDLVLEGKTGIVAIGDVKYKAWPDRPDEHDLYQLLVHAAAYDASCAFLVYPHDTWLMYELGVAATGCRTWVIGVDIANMQRGLQAAVEMMGILP